MENLQLRRFRLNCEYYLIRYPLENPQEAPKGETFWEKVEAIREQFVLERMSQYFDMTSDEVAILDDLLEKVGFPKLSKQFNELIPLVEKHGGEGMAKRLWGEQYKQEVSA